jgi:hypothetical protein
LQAAVPVPAPPRRPTNLPEPVSELIGRTPSSRRSWTSPPPIAWSPGAGGIGKTRLGLELAQHLLPEFADGVWAIELASLSDPDLVPATVD